jgi:hypothetical protein
MNVGTEISAVIYAAEHPLCVRNEPQEAKPGAIRRCSVYRKAIAVARLDAKGGMGSDSVADSRLGSGWSNDHWIPHCSSGDQERTEAGSVNAIVIAQEELHR